MLFFPNYLFITDGYITIYVKCLLVTFVSYDAITYLQ